MYRIKFHHPILERNEECSGLDKNAMAWSSQKYWSLSCALYRAFCLHLQHRIEEYTPCPLYILLF